MIFKRESALLLQKYFETRFEFIDQGLEQALSFEDEYAANLKKAMYEAVIPGGKDGVLSCFFLCLKCLPVLKNTVPSRCSKSCGSY